MLSLSSEKTMKKKKKIETITVKYNGRVSPSIFFCMRGLEKLLSFSDLRLIRKFVGYIYDC